MPEHLQSALKKTARVSRQSFATIAAKKIASQSLFNEEANEIFKSFLNSIKQEMCTCLITVLRKVKKILVWQKPGKVT